MTASERCYGDGMWYCTTHKRLLVACADEFRRERDALAERVAVLEELLADEREELRVHIERGNRDAERLRRAYSAIIQASYLILPMPDPLAGWHTFNAEIIAEARAGTEPTGHWCPKPIRVCECRPDTGKGS